MGDKGMVSDLFDDTLEILDRLLCVLLPQDFSAHKDGEQAEVEADLVILFEWDLDVLAHPLP